MARNLPLPLAIPVAFIIAVPGAAQPPAKQAEVPFKERYTTYEVHGYYVHVSKDVDAQGKEKVNIALDTLEDRLGDALKVIPKNCCKRLQKIHFWVEWKNQFYASSEDWKLANAACYIPIGTKDARLIPEKDGGIEVPVFAFLLPPYNDSTDKSYPFWLMHELAHAYHDRVLGFDDKTVKASYESAKKSRLYDEVERTTIGPNGLVWNTKMPAYARTNHKEYFAELSVAYLGRNCTYPHTAKDLRKHDPGGYALMKEVWGDKPIQK
ncbi:MAG TPA: hypothetical protein VKS79_15705 [Gemmataceae bacterium]|nr:hypothetical protein [Gemmataceae bacterium]